MIKKHLLFFIVLLLFSFSLVVSFSSCTVDILNTETNIEEQKEDNKESETLPPDSQTDPLPPSPSPEPGEEKEPPVTPDENTEGNKEEGGEGTDPLPPSGESLLDGDIPSFPNAITSSDVQKLKAHPSVLDESYIYIMVRFQGVGGGWRTQDNEYPRGFVLGFPENGKSTDHFVNGFEVKEGVDGQKTYPPIPGRGYSMDTGFCIDNSGNGFQTKFYCGFEQMKALINGKNNISYSFTNFVIWDQLAEGILGGGFDKPAFVRYPEQNPLTINISLDGYDPSIHKNIAYVTIYFEIQNGQRYKAVLDGFEPKN